MILSLELNARLGRAERLQAGKDSSFGKCKGHVNESPWNPWYHGSQYLRFEDSGVQDLRIDIRGV